MPSEPRRIPRVHSLCAEQVERRGETSEHRAVLVDQFGRAHPLHSPLEIGREPQLPGLAVIESSVSRRHARLQTSGDVWHLEDLESTNGTFVDGRRVHDPLTLADGQLIVVGDVGFVFYLDGSAAAAVRDTASIRATATSAAMSGAVLRLTEPSGGGGGNASHGSDHVQLGAAQFALLRILADRFITERDGPEDVRGFVRSSELLAELPWNTPYPTDNHLKQLVRRVRRALERIGLADVVDSRQRFGYRLLIEPKLEL